MFREHQVMQTGQSLEAIDLPKILKMAIESRGKDFAEKHHKLILKLNNL